MLGEFLAQTPTGVAETLETVAAFDEALTHGFGRLSEARQAALTGLAGAFGATPLGERLAEAAAKIVAGSPGDDHVAALAGGRSAALGAVHDALLTGLDTALGRDRAQWEPSPAPDAAGENLLSGVRTWLVELAVAGWRGVTEDLVSSADPLIEGLLAEPGRRRLAVLLDGFAAELRASSPLLTLPQLPVRRWADLWSRAMLLAQPGLPAHAAGQPVSGRFLPLGVDLHEHPTALQAQVHGVLETGGAARLVRVSVSAAKVDTITGAAVWRLLRGHTQLLAALAERRSLDLTGMTLLGSGDLIWDEAHATAGGPADPFATARVQLRQASAAPVPPLERHPVRLAEPVFLEAYQFAADGPLTVDTDRISAASPITAELAASASAMIGLLRWDAGRWLVQPLAVETTVKKKPVAVHSGDWAMGPSDPKAAKAEAAAGDAVGVLRERAGRLLRK
ncbi:MAG: hypothetical protein HOU81_07510 [Hamadaea sp.]|uniref:hypothetical protein n=1 Tax=Hamadaea sp. TaxID=2024425 RepID=UPI0017A50998|nr:hypothetical protein [Hamadaea sp.]NUR70652.1 hypothetical protein [Hamadaea sp.]NUT20787.1 hypothetical protein [Hamadaea sp.]